MLLSFTVSNTEPKADNPDPQVRSCLLTSLVTLDERVPAGSPHPLSPLAVSFPEMLKNKNKQLGLNQERPCLMGFLVPDEHALAERRLKSFCSLQLEAQTNAFRNSSTSIMSPCHQQLHPYWTFMFRIYF